MMDRFLLHSGLGHSEADGFLPDHGEFQSGLERYLEHLQRLKSRLDIPVVASLNGVSPSRLGGARPRAAGGRGGCPGAQRLLRRRRQPRPDRGAGRVALSGPAAAPCAATSEGPDQHEAVAGLQFGRQPGARNWRTPVPMAWPCSIGSISRTSTSTGLRLTSTLRPSDLGQVAAGGCAGSPSSTGA